MLGVSPYSNELDHLLGQIGTALGGGDDDDRSDDGRSDDGRSDDGRSDDVLDHSPSSQSKVQHSLAATTEKDVLSSIGAVQQTPRSPYDTNTASSYSYIDFGMASEQDIMDGSLAGLDMDSDNLFNDYHDHHSISDYTASPDLSLDELTLPCNDSFLKDANSNPIYTAVDCNLASNKHQQQHINTNKDNDFHLGPSGSHTGDDEFLDEHSRILLAESRKVTFSDLVQEHTISSAGNETGDWSSIELYRSVSRNIGPLDPDISIGETGVHLEESLDSSCDRVCDNQTLSNLDMTSAANSALETALEESAGIVDLSYDVPDLADTSSDTSMMSGVFEHTSPVLRMESENIVYSVFPREDTKTGDDDIYASPSRSHEDSMDMQTPRISTSCRDPFASEQETPKPGVFEIKSSFKDSVLGVFPGRKDESDTFDGAVNGITLLSASIQTDQDRMNQEYLETMLAELSALEPVKEDQDTGFSITLDAFGSTDISEGAAAADELGSIDMYEDGDHVGGSHIIDDFHQLQKDVDEYIESASKLGFNETSNILIEDFGLPGRLSLLNDSVSTSPLSDKSIHDDDSLLMNLDFDGARSKTVEHHINQSSMFQKSASLDSETFLTPHTTRTIPSSEVDLFSPGSFFAQKSGSLGSLGGKVVTEDRPSWYTPQRDEFGRVIDLIGPTPGDRIERNNFVNATPSGVRRVRAPLYDSPSRLLDMSAPPIYNTAPTFVAKVAAPPEPESGPVVVLPKPHQNTHPVHSFTSPLVKAVHHQADPPSTVRRIPPGQVSKALETIIAARSHMANTAEPTSALRRIPQPLIVPTLNRDIFAANQSATIDNVLDKPNPIAQGVQLHDGFLEDLSIQKTIQKRDKQIDTHLSSKAHHKSINPSISTQDYDSQLWTESTGRLSLSHLASKHSARDVPNSVQKLDSLDAVRYPSIPTDQDREDPELSTQMSLSCNQRSTNSNHEKSAKYPIVCISSSRQVMSISTGSSTNTSGVIRVIFETISNNSAARSAIILQNSSDRPISWAVDPVGPVFMEPGHLIMWPNAKSPKKVIKHSISDTIFRFVRCSGQLAALESTQIAVTFKPLLTGLYTQSFHLKAGKRGYMVKIEGLSISDGIKTPSSAPETYSPIPLQSQEAVSSSTKFTPSKVAPVKLKAHAQRRGGSRIEAELLGCQPISPPSTTLPHTPLSSGGISGCKYTLASTLVTLPHPKSTKKSPPLIPAYKVNDKPRILSNHPKLASSYQSKTTSSCQQDGSPFHVRSSHVITREIENKPAAIRSGHIISKSPHQNRSNSTAPSPGQRPTAEESLQPTIEPITLMNDGRSLARDSLDFGTLRLGDVLTMQLRVCNAAHRPVQVQFITTGPFSLPTQQLSIQPRSFVPIPIAFHPTRAGTFQDRLIVRKETHVIRVELYGTAVVRPSIHIPSSRSKTALNSKRLT